MSVMWHLSMILGCYSVGGFELQSCGMRWKVFWRTGESSLPFNSSQLLRVVEIMRHICGISAWCQIKLDWVCICWFFPPFFAPLLTLIFFIIPQHSWEHWVAACHHMMPFTVNLIGPSPWGFRISGGRDFKKAITVSKVIFIPVYQS